MDFDIRVRIGNASGLYYRAFAIGIYCRVRRSLFTLRENVTGQFFGTGKLSATALKKHAIIQEHSQKTSNKGDRFEEHTRLSGKIRKRAPR